METQFLSTLLKSPQVRAALGVWLLDTGCSDHITGGSLRERVAAVDRLREGRAGEEMTEASRDSERLQDVLDILLHLGLVEERKVSAVCFTRMQHHC